MSWTEEERNRGAAGSVSGYREHRAGSPAQVDAYILHPADLLVAPWSQPKPQHLRVSSHSYRPARPALAYTSTLYPTSFSSPRPWFPNVNALWNHQKGKRLRGLIPTAVFSFGFILQYWGLNPGPPHWAMPSESPSLLSKCLKLFWDRSY